MWIITLLIIITGLSYIYLKSEKDESNIILKLIGYSLLGAFSFIFNGLPIPLGFLIFLLFLKPKVDRVAKTRAVYLGLLVFLIGIISPLISNYYSERPVEVVTSSSNIYMLDIKEDWKNIKKEIGYPRDWKIDYFRVNYNEDGEIRDFRYDLIGHLENNTILYRVEFFPDKKVYSITARNVEQWLQYGRLVLADRFFEVLEEINLKEIVKQQEELEWYVLESRGEYITSAEKDVAHFQFGDDEIIQIDNSDLPISGFYISLYGMNKTSKTSAHQSYIGRNYIKYWFQH
ncbi:hypothetical protein [Desulfuribacillus alkaliarsenatis]|uniref:Uncharacterized protein n=1 Tax=Desulfuribacillus alkaliarsenatis TaxID=766136 RepID=A0A1E5FZY5_9FIRM|nr:hypothetical protein [Desulfuribacillus alkaliarsenatis]OEF96132.1 hypothetical protein BHF68_10395 [Desulfuribacillus alkaliarsenatis]